MSPERCQPTGLPTPAKRGRAIGKRVAGAVLLVSLTACGNGYGTSTAPSTAPVSTLVLSPPPPPPSTAPPAPIPETTVVAPVLTNTVELGLPLDDALSTVASGNRALLIGDSVMRSATPSRGGDLCEAMNAFGWTTTIATRSSAGTGFATTVLDEYFNPSVGDDWDAVAIFLGTDLGTGLDSDEPVDVDAAIADIDAALERLAPRPVLLVTVSVAGSHRSAMREFNKELAKRYEAHPNIAVLDWAQITADSPEIVEDDGVSLNSDGVVQLGLRFASSFGTAPTVAVAGGTLDVTCQELATN